MNIPKYAVPLYGLGASSEEVPNIAVPIKIASPGEYCDFDASTNPQDVLEESKTPWGWIVGGVALAAIATGGGYYYYSTKKSKTPATRKANEPTRTKKTRE